MAGRMGHVRQTTQSLRVVKVDTERGLLLIRGAIPGPTGGLVLVRTAAKGVTQMTLSVTVQNPAGKKSGQAKVELPAEIFDVPTNIALIHQVVVAQLAAARQGTHSTKTRGEVRGGGDKPYRQKGTGRARQGSIRAPQYAGGGVAHGPTPRSYDQRTPKKMKAAALRGALSDRARHDRVHVVTALVAGDAPSTQRRGGHAGQGQHREATAGRGRAQ